MSNHMIMSTNLVNKHLMTRISIILLEDKELVKRMEKMIVAGNGAMVLNGIIINGMVENLIIGDQVKTSSICTHM